MKLFHKLVTSTSYLCHNDMLLYRHGSNGILNEFRQLHETYLFIIHLSFYTSYRSKCAAYFFVAVKIQKITNFFC